MSVQNVVLGELVRRRGYGYEIADRLRVLFTDLFEFSNTVVYPALTALERKGLIVEVDREPARRDERWSNPRIVYEVTPEGRKRFAEWMEEPARKAPMREELHMKLVLAEMAHIPALLEALRTVEDECHEQLRRIEPPRAGEGAFGVRRSAFGALLVQDAAASHLQTTIEWAQRSRVALRQLAERHAAESQRERS